MNLRLHKALMQWRILRNERKAEAMFGDGDSWVGWVCVAVVVAILLGVIG